MDKKEFWEERNEEMMKDILKKEGYIQETNKHGVKIFRKPRIVNVVAVVMSGRPIRDTVISKEDITNFKIALETSKTIEEFLRSV